MENLDILQALLKKRVATNSESGPQIAPRPILLQVDNNQSSLCRRIADEWRLPEWSAGFRFEHSIGRNRRIVWAPAEAEQVVERSDAARMSHTAEAHRAAGDLRTPVAETIGGQMCIKYSVLNMMPSFFSSLS